MRASHCTSGSGCDCGCGGGWTERAARRELADILARVSAGVWKRESSARVEPSPPARMPTFHEYASQWFERRCDGVLGDRPLSANSRADYLGRLRNHLLPFFGTKRLDEIDTELCLAFKAHKIREARDLEADLAAGADLTTPHSLRRTYIWIAFRANNYDVKWVMSQVGHADSKMTLDVYAQLEQRAKRDHGARFDELAEGRDDQPSEDTTEDRPPGDDPDER